MKKYKNLFEKIFENNRPVIRLSVIFNLTVILTDIFSRIWLFKGVTPDIWPDVGNSGILHS